MYIHIHIHIYIYIYQFLYNHSITINNPDRTPSLNQYWASLNPSLI